MNLHKNLIFVRRPIRFWGTDLRAFIIKPESVSLSIGPYQSIEVWVFFRCKFRPGNSRPVVWSLITAVLFAGNAVAVFPSFPRFLFFFIMVIRPLRTIPFRILISILLSIQSVFFPIWTSAKQFYFFLDQILPSCFGSSQWKKKSLYRKCVTNRGWV